MTMANEKSKSPGNPSRRKFFIRAGIGAAGLLTLGVYLFRNPIRRKVFAYLEDGIPPYMGEKKDPLVWFELTPENRIVLHSPKVEMGQGVFTGLAQIAADELEVDIDQIDVVHAATNTGNIDEFGTGGSSSIASLWIPLRELAATLREMLKAAAAEKWGVSLQEITARDGVLRCETKTMTYTEATIGKTKWKVPTRPALKPVTKYKYIGKPVSRVDLKPKVFGSPIFGMDRELKNMLYGAVVRPSLIGAKFVRADISQAEKMPGVVQIVQEKDFVGVVATSRIAAHNAKNLIKVTWSTEKVWSSSDISALITVGKGDNFTIQTEGNVDQYLKEDFITSEYQEVAKRLQLSKDQVTIIPTFLGGGFGRRLYTPHAIEAAVMSKAVGRPVKCFFSRAEEFQNDMFRPLTHHVMKGKLDDQGNVEALEHQFASGDVAYHSTLIPGIVNHLLGADAGAIRGGFIQYDSIANYRAIAWHSTLPFATSWWRGLGLLANTFAIESFIDELAVRAGKDPVSFRITHLGDSDQGRRLRKVIEVAADRSGYHDDPKTGTAMGIAASTDSGTPCAHVAEVTLDGDEIRILKVTCVLDAGLVVNPDQVKAQCEGNIIMGISASLYEEMFIEKGELRPLIYGPYKMALMKHAPRDIEVFLLEGSDHPGSVGEPPLGPIAAAIANAVFRLSGQRLRNLPLRLRA
jgi:isoquinoline 1-oxidoreductase beta subunit